MLSTIIAAVDGRQGGLDALHAASCPVVVVGVTSGRPARDENAAPSSATL